MILVVGATGQLGHQVVRQLRAQGRPVRAVVRWPAAAQDVAATGAELVTADLREPGTLDRVLAGVRTVVATANVVTPTRAGDAHAAAVRGYAELIARAERAGVRRFVYASVPVSGVDEAVPPVRAERRAEEPLAASTLSWVSLRLAPFTEVWLALVGSSLLDRHLACQQAPWDTGELTRRPGLERMRTVAEVLRDKALTPAAT